VPRHRKADRDLLDALARTNQQLGRLGVQLIATVDEARRLPDYEVRDIVNASRLHLDAARRALRGITG
jgi:hypothetical protein